MAGLVLTALMTWWREPFDDIGSRLQSGFNFEGVAPTVYTLFAAALVVALGVVLRRTATAIGLAVVAFFVIRIGIEGWLRQHFVSAVHKTWTGDGGPDLRGAWILSQSRGLRAAEGYPNDPTIIDSCINTSTKSVDRACLAQHHIVEYGDAVFHPANRFWLFQGIESGLRRSDTRARPLLGLVIRKRIN